MPQLPEQRILNDGKKLIGLQITGIRYMSEEECVDLYIDNRAIVLTLSNGTILYPMVDDEGNDAGVLIARSTDGHKTQFSRLWR